MTVVVHVGPASAVIKVKTIGFLGAVELVSPVTFGNFVQTDALALSWMKQLGDFQCRMSWAVTSSERSLRATDYIVGTPLSPAIHVHAIR